MKMEFDIEKEQKELVLARLKTLNMDSKILLGGDKEYTVKDMIKHIEDNDDFGRKVVEVQIKMLKILTNIRE